MGLLLEMCLLYVWSSDFILLFFYFLLLDSIPSGVRYL